MGKARVQILLFCMIAVLGALLVILLFQLKLANVEPSLHSNIVLICVASFAVVSFSAWFCSRSVTSTYLPATEKASSKILSCISPDPAASGQSNIAIDELAQKIVEELEFSQQGQSLIADYASDVLCCLSEDRKFLNLNSQAETILGYSESTLLAVPIEAIVLDEYKRGIVEFFQLRKSQSVAGPELFEFRLMKPSGEFVDLSLHCEWSNSKNCFFCLAKNITAIKDNERLKAEISAMVTHDLRTPIAGFRFLLENLESGVLGELSEAGKQQVLKAGASIEQVLLLINQLLDVEKIEGGQMELELNVIASSQLYESCSAMVQALAEKKNIELLFPSSQNALLFADFERSKQILSNLLSNAIKWSPENSVVVIKEETDAATTKVSVTDTGPGIAPSQLKVIFERFKSLDGRSDKEMASSGLGLYLCKKLTELQGGSIGVKSMVGEGSTFWFTLPTGVLDE